METTTAVYDVITTSSFSLTTATSDSDSISVALYAIAIPILVWIFALVVCYPITFLTYRFVCNIRIRRKRSSASSGRHGNANDRSLSLCCCTVVDAAAENESEDEVPVPTVIRRPSDGNNPGGGHGWTPAAWSRPPPAYEVALTMPKPRIGDAVRFQNSGDGGWCTFTYVTNEMSECPPPTYDAFYSDWRRHSSTTTTDDVSFTTVDIADDSLATSPPDDVTLTVVRIEMPDDVVDQSPSYFTSGVIIDVNRL